MDVDEAGSENVTLNSTVYEDAVDSQSDEEKSSNVQKHTMKVLESDIEASNNKKHWITDREMTLELEQVCSGLYIIMEVFNPI